MLDPEVALALGYATFLLVVSGALGRGARRVEREEGERWPQSDAAKLRRGLALVLLALTGVLLGAEIMRHPHPGELLALGCGLIATAWMTWRGVRALLRLA